MSAENRGLGAPDPLVTRSSLSSATDGGHSESYGAGDVISGKYRLVRPIGHGGMGVVWEAHSETLDIPVAVKLIQNFSASRELQQRLLLEARAAARLVDPGVIRIFDCGETSKGDPYIVMELLDGEDLAARLERRGRLSPIEAVRTLLPIVRALAAAHNANIVHRDVKPENVYFTKSLTAEEQPKLFDFGIAKVDVSWEKRLTQAGSTLGSPSYMSPEQAQGNEIDARSDLWGFSVVLYESITGVLPFDGHSYQAIVHAILCADPKPFRELGIEEPELWSIVSKGLERDRENRWRSSTDLGEALGAWLIERGIIHDVTGASLHATRANARAAQASFGGISRPPSRSGNQLRVPRSAMVETVNRSSLSGMWFRSPRGVRYAAVLVVIALFGAFVSMGIKKTLLPSRSAPPSHAAAATPLAARVTPIAEPDPKPVQPTASSSLSSDRAPPATQAAIPSPAPASKPPVALGKTSRAKAKGSAPKDEPFKSPFE